MPYIGREPLKGRYTTVDDISSSFDGSETSFTLSSGGATNRIQAFNPASMIVSLGGVIQKPTTDFTVSGSTITFTTAPASGTTFFAYLLGDTLNVGQPSDRTVGAAQIIAGGLPTAAIADGAITSAKIDSNVSLGGSQFRGNNGTVGVASNLGDIFRVANTVLTANVSIDSGLTASAAGPLEIAVGTTLTINGTAVIL